MHLATYRGSSKATCPCLRKCSWCKEYTSSVVTEVSWVGRAAILLLLRSREINLLLAQAAVGTSVRFCRLRLSACNVTRQSSGHPVACTCRQNAHIDQKGPCPRELFIVLNLILNSFQLNHSLLNLPMHHGNGKLNEVNSLKVPNNLIFRSPKMSTSQAGEITKVLEQTGGTVCSKRLKSCKVREWARVVPKTY